MTEEETEKFETITARIDRLAAKMDLVCETPLVLAGLQQQQLAENEAAIAAGQERLAVIALKEAALTERETVLDQREAALDQRARANKVREFTFDQKVEEATGQLRVSYLALAQSDRALKLRVLNFSGMLSGFDVGIMELPDWSALERMLGVADAIPEMQDTPELTREGWSGDKFAPSTLTRSTPMSEHDALPTPPPPVQNKRPARRSSYRAAYRRALGAP